MYQSHVDSLVVYVLVVCVAAYIGLIVAAFSRLKKPLQFNLRIMFFVTTIAALFLGLLAWWVRG